MYEIKQICWHELLNTDLDFPSKTSELWIEFLALYYRSSDVRTLFVVWLYVVCWVSRSTKQRRQILNVFSSYIAYPSVPTLFTSNTVLRIWKLLLCCWPWPSWMTAKSFLNNSYWISNYGCFYCKTCCLQAGRLMLVEQFIG